MRRVYITTSLLGGVCLLILVTVLASMPAPSDGEARPPWPAEIPYRFAEPITNATLDPILDEISGIALDSRGALLAVQDEDGIVFQLNQETGEILSRTAFGRKGDYEDIAVVGDRIYILRSDGAVFVMKREGARAERLDVKLHKSCDAEGMTYEVAKARLLVACKSGPRKDRRREIYALDLATGRYHDHPAYVIDLAELAALAAGDATVSGSGTIPNPLPDMERFRPSAIDFHPTTGELYVLSATGNAVLVLSADGSPRRMAMLPEALFEQAEGMAFLPDGSVLITNERGARRHATLLRFAEQTEDR